MIGKEGKTPTLELVEILIGQHEVLLGGGGGGQDIFIYWDFIPFMVDNLYFRALGTCIFCEWFLFPFARMLVIS